MQTLTLQTRKTDITQTQWHSAAPAPLADGQARMRIDQFSFTANNATYAAFGDAMKYWNFFPQADAAWGCVPVWGFAEVTESRCEGVAVGTRYYGYYPFATELIVQPTRVNPATFVDGAVHRAELAAVYNQYLNVALDPGYRAEYEAHIALLRPLFITSFLIDDFLADSKFFDASALVLSSASSKTAYGTAYALAQRAKANRPAIVGLTSSVNLAFTQRLGLYDHVLTYDQINTLDAAAPTVYVDFSGSVTVRQAVHTQCKGLTFSSAIGGTHWQDRKNSAAGTDLPGPRPTLFFAPSQVKKRLADWGPAQFQAQIGRAMQGFIQAVNHPGAPWMTVVKHHGQAVAVAVYNDVISGKASAELGMMVALAD